MGVRGCALFFFFPSISGRELPTLTPGPEKKKKKRMHLTAARAARRALVACCPPGSSRRGLSAVPRPVRSVAVGAGGGRSSAAQASGGPGDGHHPPAAPAPTAPTSTAPATPPLPPARRRLRLDEACLAADPSHSRSVYQSWIARGKVFVDGRAVTKAGAPFKVGVSVLDVRAAPKKFVCRGGTKLEAALDAFAIDVTGLAALDCGLSTGGFADCLLQRGAAAVLGVDVGYGQVDGALRNHPALFILERANMRHVTRRDLPAGAPSAYDLASLDVSFISVLKILPAVAALLKDDAQCVVLVKPQFEAGRAAVGSGGVVRDPAARAAALAATVAGFEAEGWTCRGTMESPLRGAVGGNVEFLAHFVRGGVGVGGGGGGGGGEAEGGVVGGGGGGGG